MRAWHGDIVAEHGHADAVIAANALSHIADLHAVVEGIEILLAPDGTCVIEDPYWGDVVAQTAFDQIYDEHASYFTRVVDGMSIRAARPGCDRRGSLDVHGGSMRYVIGHAGSRPSDAARLRRCCDREQASGLHSSRPSTRFRERVSGHRRGTDGAVAQLQAPMAGA